jgi:UPF0271 protein
VSIDLDADLGEGLDAADEAILPLITSASIACGGHAGDDRSMARAVRLALDHGVAVGAHPSYPDREGFGCREIDITADELRHSLIEQIEVLATVAGEAGSRMAHVRPHGALFERASIDAGMAVLVAEAVRTAAPGATLVGPAGSKLLEAGRAADLTVAAEGLVDRAYEPDGSLRPRSRPGAVLEGASSVAAQALSIARDGRAPLDGGGWADVRADTLFLHSAAPAAVAHAEAIRTMLEEAGIGLRALTPERT